MDSGLQSRYIRDHQQRFEMSKKLVVTTDFSAASKAGIRFALEYARRTKRQLIFYYCFDLLRPTRWSDKKFESYKNSALEFHHEKLSSFVKRILEQTDAKDVKYQCVVEAGMDVAGSVIDFAVRKKASAICLSTRGAGRFKRIIGTNASKIITYSSLPVFIIPKNYRRSDINTVFYASDLSNLSGELPQVRNIADAFSAKALLYHYSYQVNMNGSASGFEPVVKKYKKPGIDFHFSPIVLEKRLAEQVAKDVRKSKSSLVVVFTDQHKSWFEKMFLSSQSAELAYDSKVPVMVIPKTVKQK